MRSTKATRTPKAAQPGVDLVVSTSCCLASMGSRSCAPPPKKQSAGDHADRARRRCGPHRGAGIGRRRYLPKPFNPRELAARIRAILRRYDRARPAHPAAGSERRSTRYGHARGDRQRKTIELTTFEFDIWSCSCAPPAVCFRATPSWRISTTARPPPSIDRRHAHQPPAQETGAGETLIKTIRGVGYQFAGRRRTRRR